MRVLASNRNRSDRQYRWDLSPVDQGCLIQIRWQFEPGICKESIVLVTVERLPFKVKKVLVREENERSDMKDAAVGVRRGRDRQRASQEKLQRVD